MCYYKDITTMDYLDQIISTTVESFDFAFCVSVNVLTYLIIKIIDEVNGDAVVSTWSKRVVTIFCILFIGIIYYFAGADLKLIINSSILAPVFWSWIAKPVCAKFNIDYKSVPEEDVD